MPYLQLDLPRSISPAQKQRLARALAERYADLMETAQHIPAVCISDTPHGGPFRLEDGNMREVAVLMCDVRRGRGAEQRERAARGLIELIAGETGIDPLRIVVEFTQHEATEMFRYGAFAPEWQPDEANAKPR